MYSHLSVKGEVARAIFENRQAVALCGHKGNPKTFRGDLVATKPLCPECKKISDSRKIHG